MASTGQVRSKVVSLFYSAMSMAAEYDFAMLLIDTQTVTEAISCLSFATGTSPSGASSRPSTSAKAHPGN
jgi:hypothetical protein